MVEASIDVEMTQSAVRVIEHRNGDPQRVLRSLKPMTYSQHHARHLLASNAKFSSSQMDGLVNIIDPELLAKNTESLKTNVLGVAELPVSKDQYFVESSDAVLDAELI